MNKVSVGPQSDLSDLESCFDGVLKFHCYTTPGAPDWRQMKAQCWQESRFNPVAVSTTGPVGLFQFSAVTWAEWSMPGDDRRDAYLNAGAATRYMAKLTAWARQHGVAGDQVPRFALGAFNAGMGNLRQAMEAASKAGADPLQWGNIPHSILAIVGPAKTEEIVNYVNRILERLAFYISQGTKP